MATLRDTTVLEIEGSINANSSPPTITAPTVMAGDLLMVACFWAQGVGTSGFFTPSNMTMLSDPGTSTNRQGAIFAAVVDDPSDFSGGISLRSGATSTRVAAVAWSYQPGSGESFTIEGITVTGPDWNGSSMNSDDFPGGVSGDIIFGVSMTNKSASTTYTVHSGAGGATAVDQAQSLGGSPPSSVADSVTSVWVGGTGVSFNISQANGQTYSIGVTLLTDSGIPFEMGDGTPVHVTYTNGSGIRVSPKSIRFYYPGFSTIAEMESVAGATWAHRGGSAVWPEMSEYAYDRSVMRGYGVLEFSARRTNDGVWFGIHDTTLARTSENVALTDNVADMNWEDVEEELNTLNSNGIPRPYYLLDDFLAKYRHHVLLVDNKGASHHASEFLPKLLGVPDATQRIIVKMDGVTNATRFQESKSAGFKVAGYWFDDNYETNLPSRVDDTDYIGMNYNADSSVWDEILLFGKMTWGHVCPNQSAYNTAISKGADFVQCSAVDLIAPVR